MNESLSVPWNSLQQWSEWKENVVRNIPTVESSAMFEPGPNTDIKDFNPSDGPCISRFLLSYSRN